MIIVDGPDGSGKTTLIEMLGCERRSFKALRGGIGSEGVGNWGGDEDAPVAYARQVLGALEEERREPGGARIAFDRFHLSEMVYGPILREGSAISDDEAVVLQRLLRARSVPTVVCLPPYATTFGNVNQEGRERPAYQTVRFLGDAYEAWNEQVMHGRLSNHSLNLIHVYDYTRPGARWIVPTVTNLLGRAGCPEGVVGDPRARVLVVGERSNLPLDLPFFSMRGSAGYLNHALWRAGFREEDLAFTNALHADGTPRNLAACIMPSTRYIVALGLVAAETCRLNRIEFNGGFFTIPHPQYWKRFHASDRWGYIDQLKTVRTTIASAA